MQLRGHLNTNFEGAIGHVDVANAAKTVTRLTVSLGLIKRIGVSVLDHRNAKLYVCAMKIPRCKCKTKSTPPF